jgi:molybdenum cofactor synthesis domain-containing protein
MINLMSLCRIASIGNELLIGEVINSNATYIAKFLHKRGYFMERIICVRDDYRAISDIIADSKRDNIDFLFTTGGLGPTYDDITIEAIAQALNVDLVLNEETVQKLKIRAESRGHIFNDTIKKMAYLPKGSTIIPNLVGAAPGADIRTGSLRIFVLPGVPSEMKLMIKSYVPTVLPNLGSYFEKKMIIKGIGESGLAQTIREIAKSYDDIYIKSHPKLHQGKYHIILHIYVHKTLSTQAAKHVEEASKIIIDRFGKFIQ